MTSVEAYYPPSMQYMDEPVRDKAFDIFNALTDGWAMHQSRWCSKYFFVVSRSRSILAT